MRCRICSQLEALDSWSTARRPKSHKGVDGGTVLCALRLHVFVEQLLASPALQENNVLGIVNALEQLVLLAAILLLDDRPQGLESASEIVGPARSNLDRDDVPNGHTSLVERRVARHRVPRVELRQRSLVLGPNRIDGVSAEHQP